MMDLINISELIATRFREQTHFSVLKRGGCEFVEFETKKQKPAFNNYLGNNRF